MLRINGFGQQWIESCRSALQARTIDNPVISYLIQVEIRLIFRDSQKISGSPVALQIF